MDLSMLLQLGQALKGFQGGQKVAKATYGEQNAMARAQDINRLSGALGNPNDPLYKTFETQEMDAALNDYTQGLQQLINENRRAKNMGRTPLFDEERGGEQIFRAGMLARNQAGQTARDSARKRIAGGIEAAQIGGKTGMMNSDSQRGRRSATAANQMGLISDVGDIFQSQGGLGSALNFGSQPRIDADYGEEYFKRPGYQYTGF